MKNLRFTLKNKWLSLFLDILLWLVLLSAITILGGYILLSQHRGQPVSKSFKTYVFITSIESAIAMYQNDMEGYFGDYSGIIGNLNSPDPLYIGLVSPNDALKAQPNFSKDWHGIYIKEIPKDPWGEYYYYTNNKADVDGTNKQVGISTGENVPILPYYIYSKGKDKLTGLGHNADDINSWDEKKLWRDSY